MPSYLFALEQVWSAADCPCTPLRCFASGLGAAVSPSGVASSLGGAGAFGASGLSTEPRPVLPSVSENGLSARIRSNSSCALPLIGATLPVYTPPTPVVLGYCTNLTWSRSIFRRAFAIEIIVLTFFRWVDSCIDLLAVVARRNSAAGSESTSSDLILRINEER